MPYVSLYGRNPEVLETTFDYPSTSLPLRRAGPTYVKLPAAASRIFGNPGLRMSDGDDNVVALDPSSVYEYTQRWKGLGGIGSDAGSPGVTKRFSNEYLEFAKNNPTAMYFGLAAITLIALGGMKILGRLGT